MAKLTLTNKKMGIIIEKGIPFPNNKKIIKKDNSIFGQMEVGDSFKLDNCHPVALLKKVEEWKKYNNIKWKFIIAHDGENAARIWRKK